MPTWQLAPPPKKSAVAVESSDVRTGAEAEALDEEGDLEDALGEWDEHGEYLCTLQV